MFAAICFLEVVANFDAGVLPACVVHVMKEFDLDYSNGGIRSTQQHALSLTDMPTQLPT
jgi:hypothetical protein